MISEREFQVIVGYRVRLVRAMEGESQARFAKRLRVGDTAVSNYESGVRPIDSFQALLLKQQLAVPLEWLYAGEEGNLTPAFKEKLARAIEAVEAERDNPRKRGRPKAPAKKVRKVA